MGPWDPADVGDSAALHAQVERALQPTLPLGRRGRQRQPRRLLQRRTAAGRKPRGPCPTTLASLSNYSATKLLLLSYGHAHVRLQHSSRTVAHTPWRCPSPRHRHCRLSLEWRGTNASLRRAGAAAQAARVRGGTRTDALRLFSSCHAQPDRHRCRRHHCWHRRGRHRRYCRRTRTRTRTRRPRRLSRVERRTGRCAARIAAARPRALRGALRRLHGRIRVLPLLARLKELRAVANYLKSGEGGGLVSDRAGRTALSEKLCACIQEKSCSPFLNNNIIKRH